MYEINLQSKLYRIAEYNINYYCFNLFLKFKHRNKYFRFMLWPFFLFVVCNYVWTLCFFDRQIKIWQYMKQINSTNNKKHFFNAIFRDNKHCDFAFIKFVFFLRFFCILHHKLSLMKTGFMIKTLGMKFTKKKNKVKKNKIKNVIVEIGCHRKLHSVNDVCFELAKEKQDISQRNHVNL